MELKDGKNQIRCLFPEAGPRSWWNYAISCPNDDYRSWVSPDKEGDFFAVNRKIFRATPRHAGHVWDYGTGSVKVLEQGNQVWEGIKKLIDAGVNVYNRDLVIMKTGEKRNTEYSVVSLDPSQFVHSPTPDQFQNMDEMYRAPSFEEVLGDLKQLGFTDPMQIFTLRPMSEAEALATVVPFGQHKGKTIQQVYQADSQYILFLSTKIDRADIKEAARVLANKYMSTDYPLVGVAPDLDAVTFVPPAPQANDQQTPPPAAPPAAPPTAPVEPPAQPWAAQAPAAPATGTQPWQQPAAQTPPPAAPPSQPWQQAPVAPPAAPATAPAAPAADTPPWMAPAQTPPPAAFDRMAAFGTINKIFETNPKFKDFMLIISVMKEASAPHGKTSINDFTDEELQRLLTLISQ
jgi:hypothetical protein